MIRSVRVNKQFLSESHHSVVFKFIGFNDQIDLCLRYLKHQVDIARSMHLVYVTYEWSHLVSISFIEYYIRLVKIVQAELIKSECFFIRAKIIVDFIFSFISLIF